MELDFDNSGSSQLLLVNQNSLRSDPLLRVAPIKNIVFLGTIAATLCLYLKYKIVNIKIKHIVKSFN